MMTPKLRALLCFSFLCVARPAFADSAEDHEEEAARLYRNKQYEAAIREFQTAYALDPLPRYLFNIGQAYRRLNFSQEAVEYYLRFLQAEKRPDPTIKVDLDQYIAKVQAAQESPDVRPDAKVEEPSPYLVQDEVADAEELFEQYVRDQKAGNRAVANDLLTQIKAVYASRRDPVLLFYLARTMEKVDNKKEALEYYRRFLATEYADPQRRNEAAARVKVLTPPPPGRPYIIAASVLAAVGLAGVVTGVGLYFESAKNLDEFNMPDTEQHKRELQARGENLSLGSIAAYAAGGALLGTSAVLLGVALKKGVRQKQDTIPRPLPPTPAPPGRQLSLVPSPTELRLALQPREGGGLLLLQGAF